MCMQSVCMLPNRVRAKKRKDVFLFIICMQFVLCPNFPVNMKAFKHLSVGALEGLTVIDYRCAFL